MAAPARADRGEVGLVGRLLWPGGGQLGAAVAGSLGVADAWALGLEAGARTSLDGPARPAAYLVAGPTWLWDVLRWVPSVSVAGGLEVAAGGRVHPAALGRAEVRFFWRPTLSLHGTVGARYGRRGVDPEVGVGVGLAL